MPITNGKYVAPTWSNGGGTPLSAANLQDMSDALAFSGRIAVGSYTGTGKYGTVASAVNIYLPFKAKFLFVYDGYGDIMMASPMTLQGYYLAFLGALSNTQQIMALQKSAMGVGNPGNGANTFAWYLYYSGSSATAPNNALAQMNESGVTYNYIALG